MRLTLVFFHPINFTVERRITSLRHHPRLYIDIPCTGGGWHEVRFAVTCSQQRKALEAIRGQALLLLVFSQVPPRTKVSNPFDRNYQISHVAFCFFLTSCKPWLGVKQSWTMQDLTAAGFPSSLLVQHCKPAIRENCASDNSR